MSKELNWSAIANVNFDDKRRQAQGIATGKEMFQKAYEQLEKAEAHAAKRKEIVPILKHALVKAMVGRESIKVLIAIKNPTETSGGHEESDDGFYNGGNSQSIASMNKSKEFQEVMETIPVGCELVYKSWVKSLSQWIFTDKTGREYAIYDKDVIIYKGQAIENPGLYGLLFNTTIAKVLGE